MAPTLDHLHRLSQIGGKYTFNQTFQPGWGSIALLLTPRGFATPTLWSQDVTFDVRFEILDDTVTVNASTGNVSLRLQPGSVADFYTQFLKAVQPLGISAPQTIIETEIADGRPFDQDTEHRPYDLQAARNIWAALAGANRALTAWQAPYRGYRPPVGIMWGGFDLYAPRYNGRQLPPREGAPAFQQNGMTEEVVAVGFSFGDSQSRTASIYAYISPSPKGLETADFAVKDAAFYPEKGLIILPWTSVCASKDPQATIIAFADAVHAAAVTLGDWPANAMLARQSGWHATKHLIGAP